MGMHEGSERGFRKREKGGKTRDELPHKKEKWKPTLFDVGEVRAQVAEKGYFELPAASNVDMVVSIPGQTTKPGQSSLDEILLIRGTLDNTYNVEAEAISKKGDFTFVRLYSEELKKREHNLKTWIEKHDSGREYDLDLEANITPTMFTGSKEEIESNRRLLDGLEDKFSLEMQSATFDLERILGIKASLAQKFLTENKSTVAYLAEHNIDIKKIKTLNFSPTFKNGKPEQGSG